MRNVLAAALVAARVGMGFAAHPAEPLKIGMMVTLSGPPAVLGKHINDGFQLFVEQQGGKLGGRDVEIIVADDELKPDVALTKVKGLLERYFELITLALLVLLVGGFAAIKLLL